jgi:hypothetical protein
LNDIDCGDLKLDGFGNLYFIDRARQLIGKIENSELEKERSVTENVNIMVLF